MVGTVFLAHIATVAFILGIAILAPIAEWLGTRPDGERWSRLSYDLSHTIVLLFAFGATWVVFALMMLYGLYPYLFNALVGIFFWIWVGIGILWIIMTVSAYVYYESRARLGMGSWRHMAIGWTFAVSSAIFISLVTATGSYQLTPTSPTPLITAFFTAAWGPQIIHRQIGNVSYAGLILAGFVGWRLLFTRRLTDKDRAHYDWLGDIAILIGIGFALIQPVVGWFYAHQILVGSPGAFAIMMLGANSWLFLLQGGLLGLVLFLGDLYFVFAMRRGNPSPAMRTWLWVSLGLIALLTGLLMVPSGFPLGLMFPWKYISLAGMPLIVLTNLVLYLRARRSFQWGVSDRKAPQVAMLLVGVSIMALLVTMGVIRESARGSYLIFGVMPANEAQQIIPAEPRPQPGFPGEQQ